MAYGLSLLLRMVLGGWKASRVPNSPRKVSDRARKGKGFVVIVWVGFFSVVNFLNERKSRGFGV